jgi:hypothetical protein
MKRSSYCSNSIVSKISTNSTMMAATAMRVLRLSSLKAAHGPTLMTLHTVESELVFSRGFRQCGNAAQGLRASGLTGEAPDDEALIRQTTALPHPAIKAIPMPAKPLTLHCGSRRCVGYA